MMRLFLFAKKGLRNQKVGFHLPNMIGTYELQLRKGVRFLDNDGEIISFPTWMNLAR